MKWYKKKIGRFENISELIWSFLIEIGPIIILMFALFFCWSGHAEATEFNCANKTSWESLTSKTYDFYETKIRPDGSPNHVLDFSDQLDVFYLADEYDLEADQDSGCYAAVTCEDGTGYNFSIPFPEGHAAWTNTAKCTCSHYPQAGCNKITWHNKGTPSRKSGGSGSRFPPYPIPTYPSSWNEQALYTHSFPEGTIDANITLNISANIDLDYVTTGTSASIQKCGSTSGTIEGVEITKKFYLVKGLKTHDQTFNVTNAEMSWDEDWGMCGKVSIMWKESVPTYVSWPSVEKISPVIAIVGNASYIYRNRSLACPSDFSDVGGTCVKKRPDSDGVCASGETRSPSTVVYLTKSRGSLSCPGDHFTRDGTSCDYSVKVPWSVGACRYGSVYRDRVAHQAYCVDSATATYPSCGSGWSVNPSDSSKCRKINLSGVTCDSTTSKVLVSCPVGMSIDPANSSQCRKSVVVDVPSFPVDDPRIDPDVSNGSNDPDDPKNPGGVGTGSSIPPWCTADGDHWNSSSSVCTYGTDPGFECGLGLVWDSTEEKCVADNWSGGGSGNGGGTGEGTEGIKADEFFQDAPVATSDKIGTRTIGSGGFYTPAYGAGVSFASLFQTQMASSGVAGMTSALSGLAPPVYEDGGLPTFCLQLSFMSAAEKSCVDMQDYSYVFDLIKIFFYFTAVMTSWRIIIGAK